MSFCCLHGRQADSGVHDKSRLGIEVEKHLDWRMAMHRMLPKVGDFQFVVRVLPGSKVVCSCQRCPFAVAVQTKQKDSAVMFVS